MTTFIERETWPMSYELSDTERNAALQLNADYR
ncbi:MAG: DUF2750 domain-containing protein, partial [Aeromonas sp.]